MTLLAVERIKLLSTRSPWWSTLAALAVTIGFAVLAVLDSGDMATLRATQIGRDFGLMVVMVMAALAITTEYRFSTIRATFQAIPNRSAALLAKTGVVALLAAVIGEVAAFGSWAIGEVLAPNAPLAISTADDWRMIAGTGLVYGIGAVIAVAVGVLIRHSAGAISVVLIWSLLLENLITLIPTIGEKIYEWLPFAMANQFWRNLPDAPLSPWWALAYFAGIAATLLTTALVVANKRDA